MSHLHLIYAFSFRLSVILITSTCCSLDLCIGFMSLNWRISVTNKYLVAHILMLLLQELPDHIHQKFVLETSKALTNKNDWGSRRGESCGRITCMYWIYHLISISMNSNTCFLHVLKWTQPMSTLTNLAVARLSLSFASFLEQEYTRITTLSQKQFMVSALGVCKSADSAGYGRGLDLPVFCCVRSVRRAAASRLQSLLETQRQNGRSVSQTVMFFIIACRQDIVRCVNWIIEWLCSNKTMCHDQVCDMMGSSLSAQ